MVLWGRKSTRMSPARPATRGAPQNATALFQSAFGPPISIITREKIPEMGNAMSPTGTRRAETGHSSKTKASAKRRAKAQASADQKLRAADAQRAADQAAPKGEDPRPSAAAVPAAAAAKPAAPT